MELVISMAEKEDTASIMRLLSQVLEIHHKGRPDLFKTGVTKYSLCELEELICDCKNPIFVAKNEERMLGYAFCAIKEVKNDNILQDTKTMYIDDLCVDESVRGNNVGKALYEYVKKYAQSIGCYSITLNVWECNPGAKCFYEKLGFSTMKTLMEKIL